MAVYKQVKRVSDLDLLSKVIDDAQVLLAVNKKNWRTSLGSIDQQKIVKIEQSLDTRDGKISSINLTMKDGSIIRLGVTNGSTGDKGKTGNTGERGEKGDNAVLNYDKSANFIMIVNDCDTDDAERALSAAQGVSLNDSINNLSETYMSDEKYQLLFNNPVFMEAEFISTQDDETVLLFNADPADHKLYIKYWTYESDGSAEYFVYNDFAKTYDSVNVDLWNDIYLGNTSGYFVATNAQLTDGNVLYTFNRSNNQYEEITIDENGNRVFKYYLANADCFVNVIYDRLTKQYDYSLDANELPLNIYVQSGSDKYDRITSKDLLDMSGLTMYYTRIDGEYIYIDNLDNYLAKKSERYYIKDDNIWVEVESIDSIDTSRFEEYMIVEYNKLTNNNVFTHYYPVKTIVETYYESIIGTLTNYSISFYIYDEEREYYTRKLVDNGEGAWDYEYTKIEIPFWVDCEYITDTEDQTILLLYNDKEQSEIETIKPVYIQSIEFEEKSVDIAKETLMDISINMFPSNINVSDVILDYDDSLITLYEDGRIAALTTSEVTTETSLTLSSTYNPDIKDTINIRIVTPVSEIILDSESIELYPGNTKQMQYTTIPEQVTNNNVKWSVSDSKMISVMENGLVELVKDENGNYKTGNCTLICESIDGFGAKTEIPVLVAIPVENLEIQSENYGFIDFQNKLNVVVTPENATQQQLKYTSSDSSIISIDPNTGVYTPLSTGVATLTATTTDGTNISKSIDINISVGVKEIKLSGIDEKLDIGLTNEYEIELLPANITNNNIMFNVSDENIIYFVAPTLIEGTTNKYRGSITAKSGGFTTISVVAADGTLTGTSFELFVSIPIDSITFEKQELTIATGDNIALQAIIGPDNATNINETLIWKSSNPAAATVDEYGRVSGKQPGMTVISAMTSDSNAVLASCILTVIVKANEISLNGKAESINLIIGNVDVIDAVISPDNTTNQILLWASSDESIVSVQENGIIKGHKLGSAIISAITTDGSGISSSILVNVIDNMDIQVTEPTESPTGEIN